MTRKALARRISESIFNEPGTRRGAGADATRRAARLLAGCFVARRSKTTAGILCSSRRAPSQNSQQRCYTSRRLGVLVARSFAYQLEEVELKAFRSVKLHLAIERHAEKPFVWPVRFPSRGGKDNEYWRTAREAAEIAKTEWLRIDAGAGSYDFYRPRVTFGDPAWPKISFSEILRIAFKNRLINGPDHIVMQTLRGEV
jgi:hypothetical protein